MNINKKLSSSSLIKIIGIPSFCDSSLSDIDSDDVDSFLKIAENNKIPLLFLRAIKSKIKNEPQFSTFSDYEEKYAKTSDLTKFVALIFEAIGIDYCFFKTIKPFPYVPSDVDVLFWSRDDLQKAVNSLCTEGCKVLDGDAYGVTMFSPRHNLNIDLTMQIAVSGLLYVNKSLLIDQITETKYDDIMIRTLSPPADLLVVVAHSVFKEQMFTLSDYYNIIILKQHWKDAQRLAKKLHLSHAFKTVLMLMGALTLGAFGSLDLVNAEFEQLGITSIFRANKNNLELPLKYSLGAIIVEFMNKLCMDPSMVNSLSFAALSLCKPNFYMKAVEHVTRKRY